MKKILHCIIYFLACIACTHAQTLYNTTPSAANNRGGSIIKFVPATKDLTVVRSFESLGAGYGSNMIQASDGKLYGTAGGGLDENYNGYGVIFSYDPSTGAY